MEKKKNVNFWNFTSFFLDNVVEKIVGDGVD